MQLSEEHICELQRIDSILLRLGKELLKICETDGQRKEVQRLIEEVSNFQKQK